MSLTLTRIAVLAPPFVLAPEAEVEVVGLEFTLPRNRLEFTLPAARLDFTMPPSRLDYTLREEDL